MHYYTHDVVHEKCHIIHSVFHRELTTYVYHIDGDTTGNRSYLEQTCPAQAIQLLHVTNHYDKQTHMFAFVL